MIEPKYKWNIKYQDSKDIIDKLLNLRGVLDRDAFLNGTLSSLKPPFLFPSMQETVERILKAVSSKESICVYGDYDADGVTSTAILYHFLSSLFAIVSYYIPNRLDEGYGMNEEAIRKIAAEGTTLIITVDNGIAATGEIQLASSLGIDVIVTDHHEPQEVLPEAYSILNPKLLPNYINIAGVAVSYKLIMGIKEELAKRDSGYTVNSDEYLDLVTIGTISDMMVLQGENRVIAKYGLSMIKNTKNVGLIELLKISGIYEKEILSVTDVGFIIAPKLNAAGRLGNAEVALRLLLAEDQEEAKLLAKKLYDLNSERQKQEQAILEEIAKMDVSALDPVIVLSSANWSSGVIGIVAAKLAEKYYRPVILLCEEEGELSGSARSIPGVNIFELIESCKKHLIRFGGHDGAAGLSLMKEELEPFKKQILKQAKKMDPAVFTPSIDVDATISLSEISLAFIQEMDVLKPFGMGNPEPVFWTSGVIKTADLIGKSRNHLKLRLLDEKVDLDLVGFNKMDYYPNLIPGKRVEVIGNISINEFNGRLIPQMQILDLKSPDDEIVEVKQNYEKFRKDLSEGEELGEKYITRQKVTDIFKHLKYLEKLNKDCTNIFHMNHNLKDLNLCELFMSLEILKELEIIEYDVNDAKYELRFKILDHKNELSNSKLYQKYCV